MQLLHLDSSILGPASVSRKLSAQIVARQLALHPDIRVVRRDLDADPALHLSSTHMAAAQGASVTDTAITADVAKGSAYLDEIIASDVLVMGVPMYNLSIPTTLKAWIDRVAVAGKTFRYTATGPEGLLTGRKAYIASARGGVYSAGSPAAALDHQETYLVGVLALLGVTDVTIVRAEGLAMGPEMAEAAVARALADIAVITA